MNGGLVSCVVTVYNGERFLAEAIDSVLDQTYSNRECIVVDDGSTDRSAGIIARYGQRVRCVRQPNAGPGAALNLGLHHATGQFLAFLDCDDLWHPGKLERQVAVLEENPDLQGCVARVRNFLDPSIEAPAVPAGVDLDAAVPGFVTGTLLARRSAFERTGPFSEARRHTAAPEWFIRARELSLPVQVLDDVLLYRRIHDRNLSYANADESSRDHLRVIREMLLRRRQSQ